MEKSFLRDVLENMVAFIFLATGAAMAAAALEIFLIPIKGFSRKSFQQKSAFSVENFFRKNP